MYKNLIDLLRDSVEKYKDKPLFSSKSQEGYKDISYVDFYKKVLTLMVGFKESGIKKNDKLFIFSDNRLEWILIDFALQGIGAIGVPRGTDTGFSEVEFIINHSESQYIIIENARAEHKLKELKSDVKRIAIENNVEKADLYFENILKLGEEKYSDNKEWAENRYLNVESDSIVTLIYTSGTTGNPKGVMLTHSNFLFDIINSPKTLTVYKEDITISILPIWHIFERTVEYVMIYSGANVYYSSIKTFVTDVKIIKPTMVIVVPRILEAFYDKVQTNISKLKNPKRGIFKFIYKTSSIYFNLKCYRKRQKPFYKRQNKFLAAIYFLFGLVFLPFYTVSRIFFKTITDVLGGRTRIIISGGGSLPPHIDDFFNTIRLPLVDGYGLTETSPIICLRNPKKPTLGTCGETIPNVEVKIIRPDGSEASCGEKGELIVKGGLVTQGYYKNKEATDRVIIDGWFHTGDLAEKTYYGSYKILGRLKDTIVLSGGENVEPEKIETRLNQISLISNSVVVGQNQKRIKALIVPNKDKVIEFAQEKNIEFSDYEGLINSQTIYDEIKKEIDEKINKDPEFKAFEKVFEFKIIPKEFNVGEELTQSLKLKRHVIYEKYKSLIDEIFKKK